MGQKTHPLVFRLGITQDHKSTWYANLNKYADILKEDYKIRTYIKGISKLNSISNLQIHRNSLSDQIKLKIETGEPGILVDNKSANLETIITNLNKRLTTNHQFIIDVLQVRKISAQLLAYFVAEQLEDRIAFKQAMRKALKTAKKQNVNGIKIQVSGRLNGADIARKEWMREGRVPLHTLSADIDYATAEAKTIYGILGIKVWVFKSEI